MGTKPTVELVEVGPRDGLQNEPYPIPVQKKIELVNALSNCGFNRIEVGSFVSPRWVPQMSNSPEVFNGIERVPNIRYSGLVPNLKGLDLAMEAGVDEVAVFVSVSEGFSKANINVSVAESLKGVVPIIRNAKLENLPVRGYVSCVIECPYDGTTSPESVAEITETLFELGCYEISLGDTIGAGVPSSVSLMLEKVIERVPASSLAGHFHDTRGLAESNILESIKFGIKVFDTSIGGLGGCPFAPGSAGNASTEKIHQSLSESEVDTGLDKGKLIEVSKMAKSLKHNLSTKANQKMS